MIVRHLTLTLCGVFTAVCVSRTMLRYFFPPAFRIPKDDVNSMTAEELVAFPLVISIIRDLIDLSFGWN